MNDHAESVTSAAWDEHIHRGLLMRSSAPIQAAARSSTRAVQVAVDGRRRAGTMNAAGRTVAADDGETKLRVQRAGGRDVERLE